MKKLHKILTPIVALVLMVACNQENPFPDFDYTAVYFPSQYPYRSLSLGDDEIDNSLDKELKFNIAAILGGVYENKNTYTVSYHFDYSLVQNLVTEAGDTLVALPEKYYRIKPTGEVTIPAGSMRGMIDIQLDPSFLDDTMAYRDYYVIPLRIDTTTADRVLHGEKARADADPRIASHWIELPMDFVLFGIQYVNEYHGSYLQRGVDYKLDASGNPTDTITYHAEYVVKDKVINLTTSGRHSVTFNGYRNKVYGDPVIPQLQLTFDANKNITVSSAPTADFDFTGTGKYVVDGDEWGGEPRDVIHLHYTYTEDGSDHEVYDTMVYRNRSIGFREFVPVVYE